MAAPSIIPTCRACGSATALEDGTKRWRCTKCNAYADEFQTAADAARAERTAGRRSMRGQIAISLALVLIGAGITIATSPWSGSGTGTWFIALGPIIIGGGQLFRILIHYA